MDYRFTPDEEALRTEFNDLFKTEMKNAPRQWGASMEAIFSEECWDFFKQMAKKLATKGWLSRPWPKEYGGADAPLIEQYIFSDVQGYNLGAGVDPMGILMLAPTLVLWGTTEQKKEHLLPMARGERFWTQLWSEPNAGSDLASVTTSAIKEGDYYIINGQKTWSSGAHHADWGFGVFRTGFDPELHRRGRGLSFILVDMKTPGINVRPILSMNGAHLFNEVFFDNVRVPLYNRVGEENQGWTVSQMTSNYERSMVMVTSGLRRIFDEFVGFCGDTIWDNKTLAEDPLVRNRLGELAIKMEVARSLSLHVLWKQMTFTTIEDVATPACAAKVFTTELNEHLTYTGCQIMGLYGTVKDSKWAPLKGYFENSYQICKGLSIAMGSNEVMRNIICWIGMGLPRIRGG
jgi:alkylation response protein AidB-like acyl-CoA dehydrogenase